ncbi:hypothetical protein PS624_01316 [Pseudomonas fluorescens]|uniref:Bacterial Ig-like domain-containing protein n=1 Tax=Pseudomonas fluorescens TaxID=294 RepID=A0A5E6RAS2_PSEFL|nr:hypothetical protein PS624_01316 [Pseudomonas fluorescens]
MAVATAPTLTSVRDSVGEVAAGGTTFDTSVTLSGKAFANQKVEIFDGTTSKGEVPVDASGNWTLPLTALSASAHSITVKALYGSNPVSAARIFTVAKRQTPNVVAAYANGVFIPLHTGIELTQRSVMIEVEVEFGNAPGSREMRVEIEAGGNQYTFAGSVVVSGAGRRRFALQPVRDIPHRLALNLYARAYGDGLAQSGPYGFGIIGL